MEEEEEERGGRKGGRGGGDQEGGEQDEEIACFFCGRCIHLIKGPSVQPGHRLPPQCLPQLLCVSYCPCCCGNIPQQCDWGEKGSVLARTSRSAYQGSEVRMEEH